MKLSSGLCYSRKKVFVLTTKVNRQPINALLKWTWGISEKKKLKNSKTFLKMQNVIFGSIS
jgi:hypothetical protein